MQSIAHRKRLQGMINLAHYPIKTNNLFYAKVSTR
jgi:hypothetical protein